MVDPNRGLPPLSLRHSIAPRVLDNSLPMATLVSTNHFSVRVASPEAAPCSSTSNILTTFIWRDPGGSVLLAGSFDDWRKHQMIFVPDIKYHILVTELPPGEYFYRFVVDGRWRIADGDPNLQEDPFGQLSHFISINPRTVASATPKRFSTVAVAHAQLDNEDIVHDKGHSDTESEQSFSDVEDAPLPPEPELVPARKRGDSSYITDYDDDAYAGLDLQADVFEAMKDVAEVNPAPKQRDRSPSRSYTMVHDSIPRRHVRQRPGVRMLRKVWAMLFGDAPADENTPPANQPDERASRPTHNQKVHGLVTHEHALKKGLKVWFPNERNFPLKSSNGRKIAPSETRNVIDAGDRALKLHQVEENANNRQMLGKNLFAQGKYDAALALFSLSVKLREDNGLKYAKTTAIAHTDVASAFIHLEDLKNADKHLNKALAIFNKGTFSGGKAQLGDIHCFLGVIGDMRSELKNGEKSYRTALELYEKCKATDDNPNYATAIENLNANLRRQRALGSQQKPLSSVQVQNNNTNGTILSPSHETSHHQRKKATAVVPLDPKPVIKKGAPASSPTSVGLRSPSKPLEVSRPPPGFHEAIQSDVKLSGRSAMATDDQSQQSANSTADHQKCSPPSTWKGLADTARASMPEKPPDENNRACADMEPPAGSYEEMCRGWQKDARDLLGAGKYKEAIDLYTLAIYTRKRHGPWATLLNVDTLVEYARALFATGGFEESAKSLKDAIGILEKVGRDDTDLYLGEVWGNLGSLLDRIGGHSEEALTAHCAGMVAYGKSGMSSENLKWLKAWKGLCIHLKITGRMDKTDEMWHSIDLQIRGVVPMTKLANVTLHR